jgi:ribosomal protein S1
MKGGGFSDSFDDLLRDAGKITDADLERLMAGGSARTENPASASSLEPGTRVTGLVVDRRGGDVLVELDGKTHGLIEGAEFGQNVTATFEHYDEERGLARLSVRGARREIFWDQLRRGTLVEGNVIAVNKGGLTVDVHGVRGFLPISQVERGRVEDLSPYVGKRLRCEVTDFDASTHNLILSRRSVLESEAAVETTRVLATLTEGQSLRGAVVRINEHGAFVDVGGFEGLVPISKLRAARRGPGEAPLAVGQHVEVRLVRVDRERGRVSLELNAVEVDSWARAIDSYTPGEEVTGWVSRRVEGGVMVSIEDGIEGFLPEETFVLIEEPPRLGAIVKASIERIDIEARRMVLRPVPTKRRT